jgi:beta-carotene ketolase (CrtW type)
MWKTVALIGLQCWLYTGLFIIAHDTMHGSLFRSNDRMNAAIGTGILFVYAGFNWRKMRDAHHDHHKFSGTAKDPDFNAENPRSFWPWYLKFFLTYFGWRQLVILFGFTLTYILLGANYLSTIIMWAVPAILSSVQLFYFGTFRTHRHAEDFPDAHNARTNDFNGLASLLSCFHFGYHHEHHLFPHEPWWRLPLRKRETQI